MGPCKYNVPYAGPCGRESCAEHVGRACVSCGAPATRGCAHAGQFVCGYPLCDECHHDGKTDTHKRRDAMTTKELPPCCHAAPGASLAKTLYAAYNRGGDPETAGLNYQGKPCPEWADLPQNVRAKWVACAAGAIRDQNLLAAGAEACIVAVEMDGTHRVYRSNESPAGVGFRAVPYTGPKCDPLWLRDVIGSRFATREARADWFHWLPIKTRAAMAPF